MSTPYRTPNFKLLSAPNSTPASNYLKRATKPPIHNPYDKFTASEFDAWVSDLKGALKKALGREDEVPAAPAPATQTQEEDEVELELEDSFAEYKSRRSAKGKGRDPREGPGLSIDGKPYLAEHLPDADCASDEYGTDEEGDSDQALDAESEEEEEEEEYDEPVLGQMNGEGSSGQPIELLSDDEDETLPPSKRRDEDKEERGSPSAAPEIEDPWKAPRTYAEDLYAQGETTEVPVLNADEDEEGEGMALTPGIGEEEEEEIINADDDEDASYPANVWLSHHDEEQSEEEDSDFSSRWGAREVPEIRDPWEGPRTYMEDFYAGGDRIDHDADPSNLTPRDETAARSPAPEPEVIDLLGDDDEEQREPACEEITENEAQFNPLQLSDKERDEELQRLLNSLSDIIPQPGEQFITSDTYSNGVEEAPQAQFSRQSESSFESYAPKEAPSSLPRARERTPTIAQNGHVDWTWPPAFPVDGTASKADSSEFAEESFGQPTLLNVETSEVTVPAAMEDVVEIEETPDATQAEIEANLRDFDEAVLKAAIEAANAVVHDQSLDSVPDWDAIAAMDNVAADRSSGSQTNDAFAQDTQDAAVASFEAFIHAQDDAEENQTETKVETEAPREGAFTMRAFTPLVLEPTRVREMEGATFDDPTYEYPVDVEDVATDEEVDELAEDDVVSVSATEYAARVSQAREYSVEEMRSEPRFSEVPDEIEILGEPAVREEESWQSESADAINAEEKKAEGPSAEVQIHTGLVESEQPVPVAESAVSAPQLDIIEELPVPRGEDALLISEEPVVLEQQEVFPVKEPSDYFQEVQEIEVVASSPRGMPLGVPLPVMADPEVPDPASLGSTPGAATPEETLLPAVVSRTLSDAGLFTPLGEGSIRASPVPDAKEDDSKVAINQDEEDSGEGRVEENALSEVVAMSEEAIAAPMQALPAVDDLTLSSGDRAEAQESAVVTPSEADTIIDVDTSIESRSNTRAVQLHHLPRPVLHTDPYPYSLSTPALESSVAFFDAQPGSASAGTALESNENLDVAGHDSDLDGLELSYPEFRSVSPDLPPVALTVPKPVPIAPAPHVPSYDAASYRYPPLYIEDMPHLRLVHGAPSRQEAESRSLSQVTPDAVPEEEEEELPKPEEEEESASDHSPLIGSVDLPLDSARRNVEAGDVGTSKVAQKANGNSQKDDPKGTDDQVNSTAVNGDGAEVAETATTSTTNVSSNQPRSQSIKKSTSNGSTRSKRSLKRKRESLAPLKLPDSATSGFVDSSEVNGTSAPAGKKARKEKGKGRKQAAVKPELDAVSEAGSSGSAASVAAHVLASSSRVPSRASSVASEPSPTVAKPSSGFKIRIKPLQQQQHTDRVFHHHGRKPKVTIPMPSLTRSRPKLPRRKSLKQAKVEAPAETPQSDSAAVSQASVQAEGTLDAESSVKTEPMLETVPTLGPEPAPEAGSSSIPKPELMTESKSTQPSDLETEFLPPAPPASPVKQETPASVSEVDTAPPSPSLSTRSQPGSQHGSQYSSPVTRSHCLYHVISMPLEEGGPRITFMVPGCSLLDRDLIKEEQIVDIREATRDDEKRAVHEIETLGFDDDLLLVLKALVSGEQHSIFYLPLPSDDPVLVRLSKSSSAQSTPVPAKPNGIGDPAGEGSLLTPASEAKTPSVGDGLSDSRSGSPATVESKPEGSSPSAHTAESFSDKEDMDPSRLPPKRRKHLSAEGGMPSRSQEAVENASSGSTLPDGPETQIKSVAAHRLKPRRSKRLSNDASAYKPEEDSPLDDSADETELSTTRKKKRHSGSSKRGTKRRHAAANGAEENGDRDAKRLRIGSVGMKGNTKTPDATSTS